MFLLLMLLYEMASLVLLGVRLSFRSAVEVVTAAQDVSVFCVLSAFA